MKGIDLMRMMRFAVAMVVGALLLSGCTEKPRVLRFYTWEDYICPDVVAEFERANNCTVQFSIFANNEEMLDTLRKQGCGNYDIILPSVHVVKQMMKEKMIVPIDHARCPSVRRNFDASYRFTVPEDPELRYSVPYAISSSGFMCATNCIPQGLAVDTWAALGNPAFKGKVSFLDDMREVIGMALMYHGHSVNSEDAHEIEAAAEQVLKWMPNVDHWDTEDYKFAVPAGRIWIGHAYGPSALQAIIGEGKTLQHPELAYVLPKEGFVSSCESLVISSGCRDADLAHAFIEFFYADAEATSRNMRYIYSVLPSSPALELLDPDYRKRIEAPPEIRAKGQVLKGFDDKPAVQALYEKAWERIVKSR